MIILLFFVLFAASPANAADSDDPILSAWLTAHQRLQTWSADVVQTRELTSLAQPLVSTGKLYYAHPDLFRWELGQPPQTIAIRSTNELLLIYPELQRAERYPLIGGQAGPMRDVLTLMEAGFPKDEAALRKAYTISTHSETNGFCRVTLDPKQSRARRLVGSVSLAFRTNEFTLVSSKVVFADGSTLQNDFTRSVRNERLPPGAFSTNLPANFKLVEPFQR